MYYHREDHKKNTEQVTSNFPSRFKREDAAMEPTDGCSV